MAKSIMTGKEDAAVDRPQRELTQSPGLVNRSPAMHAKDALLSALANAGGFAGDIATYLPLKGTSMFPGMPEHNFGDVRKEAFNRLRGNGQNTYNLQDLTTAPGDPTQRAIDSGVRTAAETAVLGPLFRGGMGLAGGARSGDVVGALSKAFGGSGARNALKTVGKYDVLPSVLVNQIGNQVGERHGAGTQALTELGLGVGAPVTWGLARGAKALGGSARNQQHVLQQLKSKGLLAENVPTNGDILQPSFANGFPELAADAPLTEIAKRAKTKGEMLRSAQSTSRGKENIADMIKANPDRIEGMLGTNIVGPKPSVLSNVDSAIAGEVGSARSKIKGVVERPRDVATNKLTDKALGWINNAINKKNDAYAAVGDARKLGDVSAEPFRTAMTDVDDTIAAGAMVRGALSKVRGANKSQLAELESKGAAATAEAQAAADQQARSLMMGGFGGAKAAPVKDVLVPDNMSVQELMQMDKEFAGMWKSASLSERFLLSKLRTGISDTLEQNPAVAAAYANAKGVNKDVMYLTRAEGGNASTLLNSLKARNPEEAFRANMKAILTGTKSGEDGARLKKLAEMAGEGDTLRKLVPQAIEDQVSQQFYKQAALSDDPTKLATAAKSATGLYAQTADFRNAVGVPESVAQAAAKKIYDAVEQATPAVEKLQALKSNPEGYFTSLMGQTPSELDASVQMLHALGANDPAAQRAISDGVTEAVRRANTVEGGTFQHGKAAAQINNPDRAGLMDFIQPELRDRITKASAAQRELEMMQPNPMGSELPGAVQQAGVASVAGLGAGAAGMSPGIGFKIARGLEWLGELRPGTVERKDIMAEALTNPEYFKDITRINPTFKTQYRDKAIPGMVTNAVRQWDTKGPEFQMPVEAAKPEAAAQEDWSFDDEPVAEGAAPKKSDEDWSFE